mmetsp:Transcript_2152/g.3316  ORF Transcript_2152/g.3316 Transcript_2152/m.3316 type:complete len:219 (+) Transcript_2152:138-794(+)
MRACAYVQKCSPEFVELLNDSMELVAQSKGADVHLRRNWRHVHPVGLLPCHPHIHLFSYLCVLWQDKGRHVNITIRADAHKGTTEMGQELHDATKLLTHTDGIYTQCWRIRCHVLLPSTLNLLNPHIHLLIRTYQCAGFQVQGWDVKLQSFAQVYRGPPKMNDARNCLANYERVCVHTFLVLPLRKSRPQAIDYGQGQFRRHLPESLHGCLVNSSAFS